LKDNSRASLGPKGIKMGVYRHKGWKIEEVGRYGDTPKVKQWNITPPKESNATDTANTLGDAKRMIDRWTKDMKEEGGAGDFGTDKLRKRYQKDTPGQPVTENDDKKLPFHKEVHKAYLAHLAAEKRSSDEEQSDDRPYKGKLKAAVTNRRRTLMKKFEKHHNITGGQSRIDALTKIQNFHEEFGVGTPTMNTGSIPATGPLKLKKTALFHDVTDKRRKKDKPPMILKRFQKYFKESQELDEISQETAQSYRKKATQDLYFNHLPHVATPDEKAKHDKKNIARAKGLEMVKKKLRD